MYWYCAGLAATVNVIVPSGSSRASFSVGNEMVFRVSPAAKVTSRLAVAPLKVSVSVVVAPPDSEISAVPDMNSPAFSTDSDTVVAPLSRERVRTNSASPPSEKPEVP